MPSSPVPVGCAAFYDRLSPLYSRFFSEHIHFGLFDGEPRPHDPPRTQLLAAQLQLIAHMIGPLGLTPGLRVLDAGCGSGATARHLALTAGVEVVGVTVSGREAAAAREQAGPGEEYVVADMERLPFGDEEFDAVLAIESLYHVADQKTAVRELARVLRPGGALGVANWCRGDGYDRHRRRVRVAEVGLEIRSLLTLSRQADLFRECGFAGVRSRDATAAVLPTWELWERCIGPDYLPAALRSHGLRHLTTYGLGLWALQAAQRRGAVSYGLFWATKPQ